ncbi:MAG: HAD-IB family hydrolase [Vicinamibacterales bacterium]
MNLALFDFDGTITSSDTWTPFMRSAVRPVRLLAGRVLLLPVVVGYRLGIISASWGRQVAVMVAFRGDDAARVRRRGTAYAADVLPSTLRPEALDRIAWHKAAGDEVVIVSGSLDVYLAPWCEAQGLLCICSTLEERAGRFTGRYTEGDCAGPEKVRRVRSKYDLDRYEVIYGYGDSLEDRELLALAHRKFYRWSEIRDWTEVMAHGHPRAAPGATRPE